LQSKWIADDALINQEIAREPVKAEKEKEEVEEEVVIID
jgi:hypothetical protein